jgi:hypothetical protein
MVSEAAGGDGDGDSLLTASGSPTVPDVATPTPTPTGKDAGGLELDTGTPTGAPNRTAQATSPSGASAGVVTASGAEGTARLSIWATMLVMSLGFVFTL